jgi:nucleotide-binding universal stress UspA family protein
MASLEPQYPSKILIAIDGSEHSFAAVSLLCGLPLPPSCSVTALAVLIPREASRHAHLEAALQHTSLMFQEKGIAVTTELLTGNPAETLAAYAEQYGPDLIALGAKGLRATLGILLGGVAQQIVEYSHQPVLVMRAPYAGFNRALVVIDGSVHSKKAIDYMIRFAMPGEIELKVLHVLPPIPAPELISRSWPMGAEVVPPMPSPELSEVAKRQTEEEEREGRALIMETLEEFQLAGIQAGSVLLRGDAATEIIHYVKENKTDLVIVGSRGLSRMKGWLLGSVSRKLVHYADCSVLVVKDLQ